MRASSLRTLFLAPGIVIVVAGMLAITPMTRAQPAKIAQSSSCTGADLIACYGQTTCPNHYVFQSYIANGVQCIYAINVVNLSSPAGLAGSTISATGIGWTPGNFLFVALDTAEGKFFCEPVFPAQCANGPILTKSTIGGDGSFSVSFVIPPETALGTHTLAFIEASSQNPVETNYTGVSFTVSSS